MPPLARRPRPAEPARGGCCGTRRAFQSSGGGSLLSKGGRRQLAQQRAGAHVEGDGVPQRRAGHGVAAAGRQRWQRRLAPTGSRQLAPMLPLLLLLLPLLGMLGMLVKLQKQEASASAAAACACACNSPGCRVAAARRQTHSCLPGQEASRHPRCLLSSSSSRCLRCC